MAATIGIKLANGEFYPILEEYSQAKKRLVLTTVLDNQRSVQIDLYRSFTETMADAQYIGSLLLEKIKSRPKGEPSIELVITSSEDGVINADGVDLDPSAKGDHQSLNVSLRSLDEQSRSDDIPDFELERGEFASKGSSHGTEKEKRKKFPWLLVICIALIITALCLSVWLMLMKCDDNRLIQAPSPAIAVVFPPAQTTEPDPAVPPSEPVPTVPPADPVVPPVQPVEPRLGPEPETPQTIEPEIPGQPDDIAQEVPVLPPVIQAPETAPAVVPVARLRNPPVASYNVPAVIPRGGVSYTIRWGDTLWDISLAFYRTPWLYNQIARDNNIRNPDLIYSGSTIIVRPRN